MALFKMAIISIFIVLWCASVCVVVLFRTFIMFGTSFVMHFVVITNFSLCII